MKSSGHLNSLSGKSSTSLAAEENPLKLTTSTKRRITPVILVLALLISLLQVGLEVSSNRKTAACFMNGNTNSSSITHSSKQNITAWDRSNGISRQDNSSTTRSNSNNDTGPHNINVTTNTKINKNYQWVGNTFIPPKGVPHYTVEEMRELFQHQNTLFIGDSTMRRAYATFSALLRAGNTNTNTNANTDTKEDGSRDDVLSISTLNDPSVVDINKKSIVEYCSSQDRNFNGTTLAQFATADGAPGNALLCRQVPKAPPGYGKLDFLRQNCYTDLTNFAAADFENHHSATKQYTLLVTGVGIWETARPWDCRHTVAYLEQHNITDNSAESRLVITLDALANLSSPNLAVIWRTSGFDQGGVEKIGNLNELTRNYTDQIVSTTTNSNISYFNFGQAIEPRSFGDDRIVGDIKAHYGLEARLLFAQMLTHQVMMMTRVSPKILGPSAAS